MALLSGGCSNGGANPESALPSVETTVTPIAAVQGHGDSSPLTGQIVTIAGVVTGDFQNADADETRNLGGFFLQSVIPDDDPDTSEGIFVFDAENPGVDVEAGQLLQVTGTVTEWFGETQITPHIVTITGTADVTSTELQFPVETLLNSEGEQIADLERFEGMLVSLADPVMVTENYNLGRYGELTLAAGDRPYQFTNTSAPDVRAYAAHAAELAARTLILDDGISAQNPDFYRYLAYGSSMSGQPPVRLGDAVTASGNIRYSKGSGNSGTEAYRLEPTLEPEFESGNPRSVTPPETGGTVTVASFNVLNYFTTIDTGQDICGPAGDLNCRGADSAREFDRQHAKTINTLLALDADVVGLMELENNGDDSLRSIVNGLNEEAGAQTWDFVSTGYIGGDAIAVGLIYKTQVVGPAGDYALLTAAVDSRFNDRKNRPALAQTFDTLVGSGRFTVAVNHLKSKGSDCEDIDDPNMRDGQANCNRTRTNAAAAMGDWLNADPTDSGDADILIIGDLNSYLQEDPLAALENAGFVNLLDEYVGPEAYSFVFDAQAGALDHAFASRALAPRISGVAEWHINADESSLIDYNLDFDRDPSLFDEATPFRASDHDPVIIGLDP